MLSVKRCAGNPRFFPCIENLTEFFGSALIAEEIEELFVRAPQKEVALALRPPPKQVFGELRPGYENATPYPLNPEYSWYSSNKIVHSALSLVIYGNGGASILRPEKIGTAKDESPTLKMGLPRPLKKASQ